MMLQPSRRHHSPYWGSMQPPKPHQFEGALELNNLPLDGLEFWMSAAHGTEGRGASIEAAIDDGLLTLLGTRSLREHPEIEHPLVQYTEKGITYMAQKGVQLHASGGGLP